MLKAKWNRCLQTPDFSNFQSTALLILRLIVGAAFLFHGWGKIQSPFSWMPPEAPVPGIFQFLAAISEFGGGIALIFGLLIPIAMLGLGVTMAVATSMHMFVTKDPFVAMAGGASYEPAFVYLGITILFFAMGPGKFSVDSKIFGTRK
jgi:putative oxidoreductase